MRKPINGETALNNTRRSPTNEWPSTATSCGKRGGAMNHRGITATYETRRASTSISCQLETGASDAVGACACALAGIAQGRTNLPIELRPPELDAAMSELAASVGTGGKPAVASAVARSDASRIELEINGSLAFVPAGPAPLAEIIGLLNPASAAVEALLNELVEAYGWHEARSIKIDLTKASPIVLDDAGGLSVRVSGFLKSHVEFDLEALAEMVESAAISAEHAERIRDIGEP